MSDSISFLGLIELILQRYDNYRSRIHDEREQNAARILKAADIIKISLWELDKFFKENMAPLRSFDPNCSREDRERLIRQITDFSERELIRPKLIQYYGELDQFKNTSNEEFTPIVGDILYNTQKVLDYLNRNSDLTSLLDSGEVNEINNMIYMIRTRDDSERLKDKAEQVLRSFDRTILWHISNSFGRLTQEIMSKYPFIPHPI